MGTRYVERIKEMYTTSHIERVGVGYDHWLDGQAWTAREREFGRELTDDMPEFWVLMQRAHDYVEPETSAIVTATHAPKCLVERAYQEAIDESLDWRAYAFDRQTGQLINGGREAAVEYLKRAVGLAPLSEAEIVRMEEIAWELAMMGVAREMGEEVLAA